MDIVQQHSLFIICRDVKNLETEKIKKSKANDRLKGESEMQGIILWTVANVVISLSVMLLMLYLYSKAVNLGWQQIGFSLCRMKIRCGIRRHIYGINIFYGGQAYFKVITKNEYTELCKNRTGKVYAYVREFPNQLLNPDFEKYEFLLQKLDWHERDKKRCFWKFHFHADSSGVCYLHDSAGGLVMKYTFNLWT